MKKQEIEELKFLASSVFDEKHFLMFEKLLNERKYTTLRIFINDNLELKETIFSTMKNMDDYNIIKSQIEMLDKMEDIVIHELETYGV